MKDLKDYSLPALKQLSAQITMELSRRRTSAKAGMLKKLEKLAREQGFTLAEVLGGQPVAASRSAKGLETPAKAKASQRTPNAARGRKLPVKYQHPSDRSLTWTGRGTKPLWVQAYLSNGGALEALERAAQRMAAKSPLTQAVATAASAREEGLDSGSSAAEAA